MVLLGIPKDIVIYAESNCYLLPKNRLKNRGLSRGLYWTDYKDFAIVVIPDVRKITLVTLTKINKNRSMKNLVIQRLKIGVDQPGLEPGTLRL